MQHVSPEPLAAVQHTFAAHLRDPAHAPPPADVPERRMAVYRELVFNNVDGLLAATFPVLHAILGEARWQALVRDFLVYHRCRTPLFGELPAELPAYLEARGGRPEDPPFLAELAHYEWVELALTTADETLEPEAAPADGQLLDATVRLSPLAWPLAYRFPVHRLGPGYTPAEAPAEPTFLVVYRDRHDAVGFLELNAVSARLLELAAEPQPGRALLGTLARDIGHPEPEAVLHHGSAILRDLIRRDVLLWRAAVRPERKGRKHEPSV